MSFTINWTAFGVICTFEGIISMDGLNRAGEVICLDRRFKRCLYQVHDFSLADTSVINLSEIYELAKLDADISQQFPNAAVALVTRPDQSLAEALIFHYRMLVKSQRMKWEVKLFNNIKEARTWCDSRTQ